MVFNKIKKWQIPISITMVFFGILLTMQFKTQKELLNALDKQPQENLVEIVKNLNDKRAALLTEVDDLSKKRSTIVEKVNTGVSIKTSVENDLKELDKANGTSALTGPGIAISITTSDNSIMYLDLVDVINELWATGAEAISVNDIRITNNTSIVDIQDGAKTAVAVDGSKLLSPITIKALGDAKALESGVSLTGGVFYNLSTLYNIHPEIRQETKLTIPATKK